MGELTGAHHSHDIVHRVYRGNDGIYLYCYNCRVCSIDDPDKRLKKECDPNG